MNTYGLIRNATKDFHLRTVNELVEHAGVYDHREPPIEIKLHVKRARDGKEMNANAYAILDVLELGVFKGDDIDILVSGEYDDDYLKKCAEEIEKFI